jgi:hypothetical protein
MGPTYFSLFSYPLILSSSSVRSKAPRAPRPRPHRTRHHRPLAQLPPDGVPARQPATDAAPAHPSTHRRPPSPPMAAFLQVLEGARPWRLDWGPRARLCAQTLRPPTRQWPPRQLWSSAMAARLGAAALAARPTPRQHDRPPPRQRLTARPAHLRRPWCRGPYEPRQEPAEAVTVSKKMRFDVFL